MAELSPAAVAALHHQASETNEKLQSAVATLPSLMGQAALQRSLDEIIAALHGGPLPSKTPGAQAVLAQHHKDQR